MPDPTTPNRALNAADAVTLIDACGRARVPVLLQSHPGEGKSSMIRGLADALGIPCETVLAPCREPADFLGLPVPTGPEDDRSMVYVPPLWARTLAAEGQGIAFFDEISATPRDTQAALLSVMLERRVGDIYLPGKVRMIAAANPPESAADVGALSPPLANRLCHFRFEQRTEDVAAGLTTNWASAPASRAIAADDVQLGTSRAMVAGFLTQFPRMKTVFPRTSALDASGPWPSPRTWTMTADVLAHIREDDTKVRNAAIYGLVGEPAGLQFLEWAKDLDLHDPEEVLANPVCVNWKQDRQDRIYATLQRLVAHCSSSAEKWRAAWQVLVFAAEYGAPDAAAAAARVLGLARPNSVLPPAAARKFDRYLKQAGIRGMGGGGPEMEA